MPTWTNWGRSVTGEVAEIAQPRSIDELQQVVVGAAARGLRLKAVGASHSFTGVGLTDGVLVRLDRFTGVDRVDLDSGLVTVRAGTSLHDLNETLWRVGLALTDLGDVDVQTIAGAISTGTHGTGARFGGLASQVRELQLVCADGALLTCSPNTDPNLFAATQIGLGALGVIGTVTLQCEPAYALAAAEAPATLDAVLAGLDELVATNDHFKFDWFPHTRRTLTKRNNRVRAGTELLPLGRVRAYIDDELLANAVFGWLNKLTTRRPSLIPRANSIAVNALSARDYIDRSYRVFTSRRGVRFREMEYAVPRDSVRYMLGELAAYFERSGEHVGFPVEVRFAAADDIWLSPATGRDTAYVAVHQYVGRDYEPYFRTFEAMAREVSGRPHWGKLHFLDADALRRSYPRFDDFRAVRERLDPHRMFGNRYLDRVLGCS
ncbi:MAG: L-gulono,4-lactone dehydrogenase [Pseudonocardiales bacterium]|jgi:L-gulonolactone oxidase|nr:L-gulono,4-lactone dehydrogenase [Pseudonocardiales bacterium]